MELSAYLQKNELTQEEFAKQLGVSQGLVWQWLRGRTRVTAERAKHIEKMTRGAITRHDLRPDLFDRQ